MTQTIIAEPTHDQKQAAWARLFKHLCNADGACGCPAGPCLASPYMFMFMEGEERAAFKHYDTRETIYV